MMTQVRRIGNSLGHIIPMAFVQQFGLIEGTKLHIKEQNGTIVIEPITQKKFPFSEQEPLVQALVQFPAKSDAKYDSFY